MNRKLLVSFTETANSGTRTICAGIHIRPKPKRWITKLFYGLQSRFDIFSRLIYFCCHGMLHHYQIPIIKDLLTNTYAAILFEWIERSGVTVFYLICQIN